MATLDMRHARGEASLLSTLREHPLVLSLRLSELFCDKSRLVLAFHIELQITAKMPKGKATKKFEQRHLKDTLDKRNALKKTKQKQQLKERKKARRAEEEGKDPGTQQDEGAKVATKTGDDSAAFKNMSVDDFFQGGFEIPEQLKKKGDKKRKRAQPEKTEEDEEASDSSSDDSVMHEPVVADDDDDSASDSDDNDPEEHKKQLAALAENDPEFHKYLQENEPELLGADLENMGMLSSDEEDDGETPKRKKQKKTKDADDSDDENVVSGKNELQLHTVAKWATAMQEQHSLRAAKETVLAFRSAAHVSDLEDKDFKYSISDPEVYHQLLTTALKLIPDVLQHHLPVQENKNGKAHVSTDSKKFKTLAPLLRSQIASIIHLLDNLSDPATLRLTLTSIIPLLPYLLSFKKLIRDICRAVTAVWSTTATTEATRIAAFLVLRRLTVIGDAGIRENALKAAYQGLVKGSRNTTVHSIAGVNLMKNSGAELWGIDESVGYTTGFTFIRQLAIHLRSSITNNSNESYKTVYNWQYVHSLDFWSRVLSAHCKEAESPLRPLIYPLVQVTMGALRLIPTATYFPLRFQLTRSLLRLSMATSTYIPLAAPLYEVLNSAEMRKAPKSSTLKPLDFETIIRVPKSYLKTRTYQDGVGEQVQELLSEFFGLWSKNIAFPELALPVVVMLKRWMKDVNSRNPGAGNKNQKVNGLMALLVQKIDANVKFIEEKRAKVEFAPNNRKAVTNFLQDLEWEKTPIGAFLVGQRKVREEKAKMLEESRKDEEARKEKDKKEKSSNQENMDDGDDSASEGEPDSEDDDEEVMEFGGDDDSE
jgi:nucleolar complex protein 2